MSKQRVYSAEGTPLNFLDTIAAVRHSKEREKEGERGRENEKAASSIIEYTSLVIDCLPLSIVFARAHVKKRKTLMVAKLNA